jgi:hypothetical protein
MEHLGRAQWNVGRSSSRSIRDGRSALTAVRRLLLSARARPKVAAARRMCAAEGAFGDAQQLSRQIVRWSCPVRHADEGRHPRRFRTPATKSWMPTFVGMTGAGGT